ncbi:hypothetical protein TTHERM_00920800 (macronuclear) [Tetrahymena thermophila SB210]|uniref:Uncharacterized protein n=1 Tax=Tetrahymena thermophila (strain SB210) TaxID=312017 RepID=Q24IJ3_TETTS|nr:hypothetical protein TTHERM_00920800 [Tetrahymena thermophila SB210]EAS07632.2 hypothetical protein TTHERM_00920800 [Tetrahymena thermophila SB210]|eukprot:XP_001027874.2 hypothetical protein TTHERM_00920800 [Tetrahymena thermophila SB210]
MDSKLTNDYFIHLRLTDILNMHEIQSILLKFWHLAYRYDPNKSGLASKITFSNCFIYEMNVDAYKQFLNCINESLKFIINYKNFGLIANYLNTTNPKQVSYETFGLHILQLFGSLIKSLNESQLLTILRRVYFAISSFDTLGKAQVLNIQDIRPIQIHDIINFQLPVRSKQNLMTPTKAHDENEEHLPSLLDSSQRSNTNANFSSQKRQQQQYKQKSYNLSQNKYFDNMENQIQNIKDVSQEDVNTLDDFNIKTNQQVIKQDNVYQQPINHIQQKSRNQIQSPSQYNQITLSNQSSNFQELFQPYHMRLQPLKKNQIQVQQEGTAQQNNHSSMNEQKEYKRRSISYNNTNSWGNTTMKERFDKKLKAIQENDKIRKELNNSFSACYPCEEKMKNQKKANLSSFVLGGYDIIDYSDTINKLHRKLLRKIILNR